MSGFDVKYAEYQRLFEERLENFCNKLNCQPQILKESLIYSLKLGGKRIRPVLMLSFADQKPEYPVCAASVHGLT